MRERTLSIIDPASDEIVPPPRRRRKDQALQLDAVQVIQILGLLPLAMSVVAFAAVSLWRLPSPTRKRAHPRVDADAGAPFGSLLMAVLARLWQLPS